MAAAEFQPRYSSDRSLTATRKYAEVAETNSIKLVDLAIRFVGTRDFVGSAIVGARNVEQLMETVEGSGGLLPLPDVVMKAI